MLISRLDATALADLKQIKQFLLNEFRLTSREYRARYNAVGRGDETYALFTSRLKNLWEFYMRSRECKDFDKFADLIVADCLKDTLSGPCLKYCLAREGNKVLRSEEIAALALTLIQIIHRMDDTGVVSYIRSEKARTIMHNTPKED